MSDSLAITAMTPAHWPAVLGIYEAGIAGGSATFETSAPDWERWDAGHLAAARLVAQHGDHIVGWAALSPVSARAAYRGVAEVSIYVAPEARGAGIGTRLLAALIAASEAAGIWTLQASVFAENEATLRLHARAGFRVVGRRERIGQLEGRWRDTLLLERRSPAL
ncbi:MAG TPA: GNAT family N-acetyltransferase [Longimicrobiales bacterium]|nr:GNAT family N-acetyltransferase [Longimicrobiales bacterium]